MDSPIFFTETFPCLIRDKETVLYQGKALSLTTWNERGAFDILPEHSHFISIIEKKIQIILPDGKTLSVPVTKAILKVYDGEVRIYMGIFSSISGQNKR